MTPTRPRTPDAAWVHLAADGLPPAFDWVALGFEATDPSFAFGDAALPAGDTSGGETFNRDTFDRDTSASDTFSAADTSTTDTPTLDTSPRLRATNLAATLPPPMVEAAREAAHLGEPTMLAALQLLLAIPDWLTETRATAWSAHGPWPAALALLVEAAGIDEELHRNDPEAVRRLAARLPLWLGRRGELGAARDMARQVGADMDHWSRPAGVPRDELFACHDTRWWAERAEPGATSYLQIEGGNLRFQPAEGPAWALLPQDVVVEVGDTSGPEASPSRDAAAGRLLAAWAVPRPVPARAAPAPTAPGKAATRKEAHRKPAPEKAAPEKTAPGKASPSGGAT